MQDYLRRVEKIRNECVGQPQAGQVQDKGQEQDEFTRKKKEIGLVIKEVRKHIKEREETESVTPGSKRTVEISHDIRSGIKEAKSMAEELNSMHKDELAKYKKKNKSLPEKEQNLERQEEVVDLVFQHIKECEALNNRRLVGDAAFTSSSNGNGSDPVNSELPDIDDVDFKVLIVNDKKIDEKLGDLSGHVGNLREQALAMGREAELQGEMLETLEAKTDKINVELDNINIRLKKALQSVRSGDRCIMDLILVIVLLGIGGAIYTLVK